MLERSRVNAVWGGDARADGGPRQDPLLPAPRRRETGRFRVFKPAAVDSRRRPSRRRRARAEPLGKPRADGGPRQEPLRPAARRRETGRFEFSNRPQSIRAGGRVGDGARELNRSASLAPTPPPRRAHSRRRRCDPRAPAPRRRETGQKASLGPDAVDSRRRRARGRRARDGDGRPHAHDVDHGSDWNPSNLI